MAWQIGINDLERYRSKPVAHNVIQIIGGFTCDCELLRFCRGKASRVLSPKSSVVKERGTLLFWHECMTQSECPVLFCKLLHFGLNKVWWKFEIVGCGFNLVTKLPPLLAQLNKETTLLSDSPLLLSLVTIIACLPLLILLLWRRRLLLWVVELHCLLFLVHCKSWANFVKRNFN